MVEKIDKALGALAFALLSGSLFLMLTLTLVNIAARWFNVTFMWIDPLVRHLVFLSAFMGGALATGKGNHIRIDLAGRALEAMNKEKLKLKVDAAIDLVSAIACFFLLKAGWDFALVELEYGKPLFLNVHSGWLVSIIPFGFGLIGLRFIAAFLKK
ncbi:MAG: TRAP transporter small permease, partial [Bacteriovoracaceae bacterium]